MIAVAFRILVQAGVGDTLPHAGLSTEVESPLPGGVAAVVRFFFNVPQWIQIGGFFLGLAVAAWVVWYLWKRRVPIAEWVRTRPRGIKAALAGGVVVLVLAAAGGGAVSWNYMQHDNGFCTGCHIMAEPFGKFQTGAGKHDSLQCHDCHQQSIYASTRQLYLWVAERPQEIGAHAGVPDRICSNCHVTGQSETWQRIASTAGHRTHLESDSSAMAELQCITCHGAETHKFVPSSQTCGQSGCHESTDTEIALGKMQDQTSLHCVTCHQFTAEVPLLATRDSASGAMVPSLKQCLSCHQMESLIPDFDAARDPHGGTCGTCHNPHEQKVAGEATKTCATAACHGDWRDEPFHTGASHRRNVQQCTTCHLPHRAKVDASDCAGCHTEVRARTGNVRPPLPFDTTRALRRSTLDGRLHPGLMKPAPGDGGGGGPGAGRGRDASPDARLPFPARPSIPAADSFPHPRHRRLACLTCHVTTSGDARLTFEAPRGCQICHHERPATNDCARCHRAEALAEPQPVTMVVRVERRPVTERQVKFVHAAHTSRRCVECHTAPVSLEASVPARTCASCHADHHKAEQACASCHGGDATRAAHARPVTAHQRCDACHKPATVQALTPDRSFCLTCHQPQVDHYPAKECTTCHFLTSPERYRHRLTGGRRP